VFSFCYIQHLYYQKTRLTLKNYGSRGCSIVVVQHSAEFFSALDVTHLGQGRRGLDQFVLDPLMIAPMAIIVGEGRDGGPQMSFAQEYQTAQTFFLN
jgi:hypothetical protein